MDLADSPPPPSLPPSPRLRRTSRSGPPPPLKRGQKDARGGNITLVRKTAESAGRGERKCLTIAHIERGDRPKMAAVDGDRIVTNNPSLRPAHYREMAEEIRSIADEMTDQSCAAVMRKIAQDYERMGEAKERIEESVRVLKQQAL